MNWLIIEKTVELIGFMEKGNVLTRANVFFYVRDLL